MMGRGMPPPGYPGMPPPGMGMMPPPGTPPAPPWTSLCWEGPKRENTPVDWLLAFPPRLVFIVSYTWLASSIVSSLCGLVYVSQGCRRRACVPLEW